MQIVNFLIVIIGLFSCGRKIATEVPSPISADTMTETKPVMADQKTPACILQKIDSIKKEPVWNPPAEIYEYEYQGRKVYAISSNCCDFFNTVVDAECKYVCAPSGGFTGRGDGKCPEFFKEAKQVRLVWKDERKRK